MSAIFSLGQNAIVLYTKQSENHFKCKRSRQPNVALSLLRETPIIQNAAPLVLDKFGLNVAQRTKKAKIANAKPKEAATVLTIVGNATLVAGTRKPG